MTCLSDAMRKHSTRKQRVASIPRLVMQEIDLDAAIMPYMALESICQGEGTKDGIDTILRELHLLQFAADHRKHETAKQICELAQVALGNMIDRVKRSGRVGISGEEKKALEVMLDYSRDFWSRQSGLTRDACVEAVNTWYSELSA